MIWHRPVVDILLVRFPAIAKNDGLDKIVLMREEAFNVTEFQMFSNILMTPRKCFVSEIVITEDVREAFPQQAWVDMDEDTANSAMVLQSAGLGRLSPNFIQDAVLDSEACDLWGAIISPCGQF